VAVGDWYRWHWSKVPRDSWPNTKRDIRQHSASRKGQRCRLVAVGSKNTVLVEFESGYAVVTDRKGLRKVNDG